MDFPGRLANRHTAHGTGLNWVHGSDSWRIDFVKTDIQFQRRCECIRRMYSFVSKRCARMFESGMRCIDGIGVNVKVAIHE